MAIDYDNLDYLPVFVYGSLMRGLHNSYLIQDESLSTDTAMVSGFDLYANGDAFPFAVIAEGDVRGEIVHIDVDAYAWTMFRLDRLEGFRDSENDLYQRIVVDAVDESGQVFQAWMYVASAEMTQMVTESMPRVPAGNWHQWLADFVPAEPELFMDMTLTCE